MAEKIIGTQEIKRVRNFVQLEANEQNKILRVHYDEETYSDGVLIRTTRKTYLRDYDTWKASQLGVAILSMIDSDLEAEDVQSKDGKFDTRGVEIVIEE